MVTSATAWVPSDIEQVSPSWLTEILHLHAETTSAAVTGVHAEQIAMDSGFSSKLYRVHLTGRGVPSSLIVKLPADSEARGAMEMLAGYQRELTFYQQVVPAAPISTPQVFAALQANEASDFVLVLEDLCGWENADHLAGLSLDRVGQVIDQLAGLHAWSTRPQSVAVVNRFPSIDTQVTREVFPAVFGHGWQVYRDRT